MRRRRVIYKDPRDRKVNAIGRKGLRVVWARSKVNKERG
jgi:hypothetical protein